MNCAGLILAAGAGRRAGGPKAAMRYGDKTFLEIAAQSLQEAGLAPVAAVLGASSRQISRDIAPEGILLVENPHWENGMFSSLRAGLASLLEASGSEAVLLTLVDHPFVRGATVSALAEAYDPAREDALLPSYRGRRGHPVLLGPRALSAVLAAGDGSRLREILRGITMRVRSIDVDDPGILQNVNRPEDLRHKRSPYSPLPLNPARGGTTSRISKENPEINS